MSRVFVSYRAKDAIETMFALGRSIDWMMAQGFTLAQIDAVAAGMDEAHRAPSRSVVDTPPHPRLEYPL